MTKKEFEMLLRLLKKFKSKSGVDLSKYYILDQKDFDALGMVIGLVADCS